MELIEQTTVMVVRCDNPEKLDALRELLQRNPHCELLREYENREKAVNIESWETLVLHGATNDEEFFTIDECRNHRILEGREVFEKEAVQFLYDHCVATKISLYEESFVQHGFPEYMGNRWALVALIDIKLAMPPEKMKEFVQIMERHKLSLNEED